jgi:hypothetical protein
MLVRALAGFAALGGALLAVGGCSSDDHKDQLYGTDADVDYHFPDGGQRDVPREARPSEGGDGTHGDGGQDMTEGEAGEVDAPTDDAGAGAGG